MSWTPIRNGWDAAFRGALVLVFVMFGASLALVAWMLWPALPADKRPLVECAICGFILGRVSK